YDRIAKRAVDHRSPSFFRTARSRRKFPGKRSLPHAQNYIYHDLAADRGYTGCATAAALSRSALDTVTKVFSKSSPDVIMCVKWRAASFRHHASVRGCPDFAASVSSSG